MTAKKGNPICEYDYIMPPPRDELPPTGKRSRSRRTDQARGWTAAGLRGLSRMWTI